jgi:hypothetical protein
MVLGITSVLLAWYFENLEPEGFSGVKSESTYRDIMVVEGVI